LYLEKIILKRSAFGIPQDQLIANLNGVIRNLNGELVDRMRNSMAKEDFDRFRGSLMQTTNLDELYGTLQAAWEETRNAPPFDTLIDQLIDTALDRLRSTAPAQPSA
jgi:hypothetical protein